MVKITVKLFQSCFVSCTILFMTLLFIGSNNPVYAYAIAKVDENRLVVGINSAYLGASSDTKLDSSILYSILTFNVYNISVTESTSSTGAASAGANYDFNTITYNNNNNIIGVSSTLSAFSAAFGAGSARANILLSFEASVENTSDYVFRFFIVGAIFSEFNEGGDQVGASVDNADSEFAQVSTSIINEAYPFSPLPYGSFGCNTGAPSGRGFWSSNPPAVECGIFSPDGNQNEKTITNFGPGDIVNLGSFRQEIITEATVVPEPGTFWLVFPGVLAVLAALAHAHCAERKEIF